MIFFFFFKWKFAFILLQLQMASAISVSNGRIIVKKKLKVNGSKFSGESRPIMCRIARRSTEIDLSVCVRSYRYNMYITRANQCYF